MNLGSLILGLGLIIPSAAQASKAAESQNPWILKNGDRVVLVGDTLIERDQRHGYLETMLTLANPDRDASFRNLGWSADTTRGFSRAGFDPPEAGFQVLKEQVLAAKPSVLVVGYGMAESFDGEAGLSRFVEGYNALLDAVAPTGARLILLSPLPHETLPPPLPDPISHNRDLKLYSQAIGAIAQERGAAFVNLFQEFESLRNHRSPNAAPDTDNGVHLTDLGYWRLATLPSMSPPPPEALENEAETIEFGDHRVVRVETSPGHVKFVVEDPRLPVPPPPGDPSEVAAPPLRVQGLAPGRYALKIDGQTTLDRTAEEWAEGVDLPFNPALDQVERLRETINAKNLLFFHRWRPQNITYLFGFRKHEQGKNAAEIPRFDPLVNAKEREIAKLREPASHTYELIREGAAVR